MNTVIGHTFEKHRTKNIDLGIKDLGQKKNSQDFFFYVMKNSDNFQFKRNMIHIFFK